MTYICCVDDYASLSFNKRRNSSDRFVIEDIINTVGEAPLRVDTYTAKLFRDKQIPSLIIDDDCLENAKDGEFVFVDRIHLHILKRVTSLFYIIGTDIIHQITG